ncbi:hypothetical protein [Embleya hyalina]|uniref:Uncharacterized protein n=1 Tax=Embleya hyalina TaxID=516124 RepID=A0A401YR27_9ACTN|nr:hypothetical protein [Embleya hyalina]GCD97053.1 hypothetical protein EHYA_04740 [Embleya hyalina]
MIDIEVHWDADYWLDEGVPRTARGVEKVRARCGADAYARVTEALPARLGSDDGPVTVSLSIPAPHGDLDRSESLPPPRHHTCLPRRHIVAAAQELRALRGAGRDPTAILRILHARTLRSPQGSPAERAGAAPTAMALMWTMHQAFGLALSECLEIGAWRTGRMADDELDDVLGRRLSQTEHHWNLPDRIRDAHRSGYSIAPILRTEHVRAGRMWLIRHLLEAFGFDQGIELGAAMGIVDQALDHNDRGADALLQAALGAADVG